MYDTRGFDKVRISRYVIGGTAPPSPPPARKDVIRNRVRVNGADSLFLSGGGLTFRWRKAARELVRKIELTVV